MRWVSFAAALAAAGIWIGHAADKPLKVDVSKLPPAAKQKVDFAKDIQPILKKSCLDCHGADGGAGNFKVDTRENILKGGEQGLAVIPGASEKSTLVHFVAMLVKDMEMPPKDAGDPLTKEQISLLRAWIDQLPKPSAPAADKK